MHTGVAAVELPSRRHIRSRGSGGGMGPVFSANFASCFWEEAGPKDFVLAFFVWLYYI